MDKREITYYQIDENLAVKANAANGTDSYERGSLTRQYRRKIDGLYQTAAKKIAAYPQLEGTVKAMIDTYAKELAAGLNGANEFYASCSKDYSILFSYLSAVGRIAEIPLQIKYLAPGVNG